jgi:hypothetical protein
MATGERSVRSSGDLAAHRTWIVGVENDHVALAQAVQAAGDTLADALKDATTQLATDEADADDEFPHEVDAAEETFTDSEAGSDSALDTGLAGLENALTSATTAADDAEAQGDTAARGTYQTTLFVEHRNKLQQSNLPATPGILTTLRTMQASSADADVAWSQGFAQAQNTRQQATSAAHQTGLSGGTNAAGQNVTGSLASRLNHATGIAAATLAHSQGAAGLLKTLDDADADATRDTVIAVRTAEAADAARQVQAEDKYDVARAIASRNFQQASENAAVAWGTSVLAAHQTYWNAWESDNAYNYGAAASTSAQQLAQQASARNAGRAATRDTALTAAQTAYQAALKSARIAHASEIGDAQITRAHEVTESAQTREQEAGDGVVGGQGELGAAAQAYTAATAASRCRRQPARHARHLHQLGRSAVPILPVPRSRTRRSCPVACGHEGRLHRLRIGDGRRCRGGAGGTEPSASGPRTSRDSGTIDI